MGSPYICYRAPFQTFFFISHSPFFYPLTYYPTYPHTKAWHGRVTSVNPQVFTHVDQRVRVVSARFSPGISITGGGLVWMRPGIPSLPEAGYREESVGIPGIHRTCCVFCVAILVFINAVECICSTECIGPPLSLVWFVEFLASVALPHQTAASVGSFSDLPPITHSVHLVAHFHCSGFSSTPWPVADGQVSSVGLGLTVRAPTSLSSSNVSLISTLLPLFHSVPSTFRVARIHTNFSPMTYLKRIPDRIWVPFSNRSRSQRPNQFPATWTPPHTSMPPSI